MENNLILFGKKYQITCSFSGCFLEEFPFFLYFDSSERDIRMDIACRVKRCNGWGFKNTLKFDYSKDVIMFYNQLQQIYEIKNNKFVRSNSVF